MDHGQLHTLARFMNLYEEACRRTGVYLADERDGPPSPRFLHKKEVVKLTYVPETGTVVTTLVFDEDDDETGDDG